VKQKYITAGVCDQISLPTQMLIWQLAASLPEKDYLLVFELMSGFQEGRRTQTIIMTQEVPTYRKTFSFYCDDSVDERLFLIDNGNYITLLLTSEY
jgi:hypothetical protein